MSTNAKMKVLKSNVPITLDGITYPCDIILGLYASTKQPAIILVDTVANPEAFGETVTVAARLQAMSVDLSAPIVVGPGAAACLPDAGLQSVGSFLLEGLQRPRTLYLPEPGSIPSLAEETPASRIRLVV